MNPSRIYDHNALIENNVARLRSWISSLADLLLEDHRTGEHAAEAIKAESERHGIRLRMMGSGERRSFHLSEHGLTKEIMHLDTGEPEERIIMSRTVRGILQMIDEDDDTVAALKTAGYAEQALCTEISTWNGNRPIAYERLALNVLCRIHPDDLARSLEGDYTPQLRDERMQDEDAVRSDDLLARFLETDEIPVAGPLYSDHPNGTLTIKKRMGMVHIGPYNIEGIMFLGDNVCLPENRPETILAALPGLPLRRAVDIPLPLDGITITSACNRGAGVEIETDGYVEAISKARRFPWNER